MTFFCTTKCTLLTFFCTNVTCKSTKNVIHNNFFAPDNKVSVTKEMKIEPLYGLEVFCDVGGVEVVHLVDHADRGGDDGIGAESARSLAQAQPQVEDGLGIHDI